ncbi:non-ribosomal peptide synthetase [Corallococcus macrosporus]|uniref:Amino acid adenylation protein n=1 Tax=Myxococcus fulvus (strain ATCC BAA-855 / HW-1) TaxID=483219 RepID=F8CPE2_MYXFH|nr:non-ribosomal peptide synthetase [Corallococcus macrosporus]AEI67904.1 amino acid adenylation protein [Corallococcus macrosporus]
MSELLKKLAGLPPEKREAILKKLRQQNVVAAPKEEARAPGIPRVSREQPLPLSFPQRRLWFLDQFEPGTPAYNIPEFVRLTGPLHVPSLERALNEVIRRHEVLRTTFVAEDGEPRQRILPALTLSLGVLDLSYLPGARREPLCQELALQLAGTSFDLAAGPLLHARLVRMGEEDHVLLLVVHHIVSDGWSTGIFVQELTALYAAFSRDKPSPLPELPLQYADFAAWQQQWMQGDVLTAQLDYWRRQLEGSDSALMLPTDRPRPRVRTYAGGKHGFQVDPGVAQHLKALGTQEKASLYMVLLAALQTLLHRYTREPRVSVGTYIANRNRTEVEPLIGFFLNTLVMRTGLEGNPSFRELLRRVVDVTLGAYAHQDIPFEKLLEELAPSRDTSHSPFFQVMLVLQNTPTPPAELGTLRMESFSVSGEAFAQFDLTLWFSEEAGGLQGIWEYNRDLFDAATVERMVAHFQTLLAGIASNPGQRLLDLPLLPASERQRILRDWNQARLDVPTGTCLHHLIEAHAARTPGVIAVTDAERRLTYAELNARANQLAHHLRAVGVGPERVTGVFLDRSVDMVVAVLAVLKAGGAYVPLDPSYPPERTALMLEDSRPAVLVTRQALAALLPAPLPPVVRIDTDAEAIAARPATTPEGGASPEHLAYVVYTSGSTGRPKGVMISHRSFTNAFLAWERDYRLPELRAHLQMASFSFDVFSGDLARALGSGKTLVLCPRDWLLEPEKLYGLMRREQVDAGEFVPAVVRLLMGHLQERGLRLDFMRLLIVGSDTWDMREYHQLRGLCGPDTRLVSSYGLSEATIDSTYFEQPEPTPSEQIVPIGRPFANSQMYLLDSAMQPVPIGIPGELFVGGEGLARGYSGQPALTAERFVPDPFSTTPGARLYRTGDLARYMADGTLAFIGRNDTQVKLRGHRIELDEVKAKLLEHPAVQSVELLVHEDAGNKQLVAYLTLTARDAATADDLRQHLKKHLPPYMVPAAFVILDAFPLTPNGKVDRKALPAPVSVRREAQDGFVAPRDEVETRLAAIWEELLAVRPIGAHDNFFDQGGHSLLAVRLMVRIREQFGRALPLSVLFQNPALEQLAKALQEEAAPRPWSPLVTLQAGGDRPALFCVPGAGGNTMYLRELAQSLGPTLPVHAFQARGLDGRAEPHRSVEEMAACYVEALRQVQPQGPYHLLGHSFGSWVAFEMAQQLRKQGETIAFLGILNTTVPLNEAPPTEAPAFDDADWMASVASTAGRLYGVDLGVSAETLRPLSAEARRELLTRRLIQAGLLPDGSDSQQVQGFIDVYKAAYQIDYVPRDTLPVPVALFRAQERHEEDGIVPESFTDDPTWGWGRHASESVTPVTVPGDHMTMLATPHVQVLAEHVRQGLLRAGALR